MAGWNGIFFNGVWSCGFDFLSGTPSAGGVLSVVNGTNTINSASARFSGNGLNCPSGGSLIGKTLGVNLASLIVGFAFKTATLPGGSGLGTICTWYDSVAGSPQMSLAYNAQGQVQFYQNNGLNTGASPSTPIGSASASNLIIPNSYVMIECLVTLNGTTGVLQCNINNTPVITFSGNTLKGGANVWANQFFIGGQGALNQSYDDWYMLDTTGSAPLNTFLGNGRIQTDGPNADSATGGLNAWTFTTPQGSDFGNCANIPTNAAQFNSSSTVGARMSFRYPNLPPNRVLFLNSWMQLEEDSAGPRTVVTIYRSNSVDQTGPTPINLPGSLTYFNQPSTIDPNTGQSWAVGSVAAAQACEIGLEVNS